MVERTRGALGVFSALGFGETRLGEGTSGCCAAWEKAFTFQSSGDRRAPPAGDFDAGLATAVFSSDSRCRALGSDLSSGTFGRSPGAGSPSPLQAGFAGPLQSWRAPALRRAPGGGAGRFQKASSDRQWPHSDPRLEGK